MGRISGHGSAAGSLGELRDFRGELLSFATQASDQDAKRHISRAKVGEIHFLPHHFGRTMFFSRATTEPPVSTTPMCGRADDGLRGRAMALEIHEPEVEMGGRQVIRVGNKDRPMSWITFHFDSEADAIAAHEQLSSALSKAVKVEWP